MKQSRGFTLLEMIVVMVLVMIFVLAALENLLPLRAQAERAAQMKVLGSLRSAIGLKAAQAVMHEGMAGVRAMHAANPMDWLQAPPPGYAGTVTTMHAIAPGQWAFVAGADLVVYRVRFAEYVKGSPVLRYRVEVESSGGSVTGVRLVALDEAEWEFEGSDLARWLRTWSAREELPRAAATGMPGHGQQQ